MTTQMGEVRGIQYIVEGRLRELAPIVPPVQAQSTMANPLSAGVRGQRPTMGVTFGLEESIVSQGIDHLTEDTRRTMRSQANQRSTSQPTPFVPVTNNQVVDGATQPRATAYNGDYRSPVWPPHAVNAAPGYQAYHPATTPRYSQGGSMLPLAFNISDPIGSSSRVTSNIKDINLCQMQQMLIKALGHRKYDGTSADGTKTIKLDEFIGHITQLQTGMNIADADILGAISTFLRSSGGIQISIW